MNEEVFLRKIGQNIAILRKEKGLSQIDVCSDINMEKSNLSAIENGRQNITSLTLKKIAESIGCNIVDFFEGIDLEKNKR